MLTDHARHWLIRRLRAQIARTGRNYCIDLEAPDLDSLRGLWGGGPHLGEVSGPA